MLTPIRLTAATISAVVDQLNEMEDEEFILIFRDRTTDEWVIELNPKMDGLRIAEILNAFQGRLLESLIEQQQAGLAVEPNRPTS